MKDAGTVSREIFIRARPETVFRYLTESGRFLEWLGIEAELEPVAGGVFRVSPNGRDVIRGQFVEVVPFRTVVFTWGYQDPGADRPAAGSTRVEITLEPRDDGTLLRLRHSGLVSPTRELHGDGWTHYLGRLEIAAAGGHPGPDPLADPSTRHGNGGNP